MSARLFATGMLLLGGMAAGAQSSQPDQVSRALVAEISGDTVRVAELHPRLAGRIYLPAGSRIVGTVGRTSLVASALPEARLLKELEQEMPKLGWKLLLHSRPDWGFVFDEREKNQHGLMFCGNGTWLTVASIPSARETRLRFTVDPYFSGDCDGIGFSTDGPWRMPPTDEEVPLRLVNPLGSQTAAEACSPSHTNPNIAQGVLHTAMSADSLVAHYARQVVDAGWRPAETSPRSRSWTRPDSTGRMWYLDLHVRPRPQQPRCHDVYYEIRPARR